MSRGSDSVPNGCAPAHVTAFLVASNCSWVMTPPPPYNICQTHNPTLLQIEPSYCTRSRAPNSTCNMDHPKTPEANASSIIHFLEKIYLMLNILIENNPCIWHNTKLHRRIPFKSHPLKSIITNGKKDVVFSSHMLSKIVSEKTRVTKK